MLSRSVVFGALLHLALSGCVESSANPAPREARSSSTLDGQQRIADRDDEAQDCPQACGIEARSGLYSDCLAEGGDRKECGSEARAWYRDCLESRCSEEDLQRDDCKTSCRTDGQDARAECIELTGNEQECRDLTRDAVQVCLDECG